MEVTELTQGVSIRGAQNYYNDLKTKAIDETAKLLLQTEDVVNALKAGWQGKACENFCTSFNYVTAVTAKNIKDMRKILASELELVTRAWVKQDNEMVDPAEFAVFKDLF